MRLHAREGQGTFTEQGPLLKDQKDIVVETWLIDVEEMFLCNFVVLLRQKRWKCEEEEALDVGVEILLR